MGKCHMDDSNKTRYDEILGRDLYLPIYELNIKFSEHNIIVDVGP